MVWKAQTLRLGAPFSFPRSPDLHQAWPLSHAGPSLHRSLRSSSGGEFLQPVTRVLTLLWCRAAGTAMRRASFCCGQQQPFAVGCSYWGRSPEPAARSPEPACELAGGPWPPPPPSTARGGAGGKFMVCIHFLAPESCAPERLGPPRPRLRAGAAGAQPCTVPMYGLSSLLR